ncbi:hypothetical protein Q7C36_020230 [Tachysurus vachellii]|uniref:Coiled-coil domain-containing protein 17 n=1 Tax=Tachysurus vachellii TaxID=175792 RepID=A0AA88LT95_TACVA|nr:hypothetical protein Q7C36_020230 [Tachysurus vachellii]
MFCIGAVSQQKSQKIREKIRRHQLHRHLPEIQAFQTVQLSHHDPKPEPYNKPTDPADRSEVHLSQDLAEVHECNAVLSDGPKQLDMQRQEFDYKLQELAAQNGKVAELKGMLLELKEQEQRNTTLLKTLMDHLQQHGTLHLSYLQSGGNDPQILAHLQHLLDVAIKLEMQAGKKTLLKTKRQRDKYLSRELVSVELENQHLEEELMKMELRKRTSRTTSNFRPAEQEMRAAKMNIELLNNEIEINHLRKQIMSRKMTPSLVTFPPLEEPRSPTLTKHLMNQSDGLYPSPYDPMTGFVVFYDFILGLCKSYRVCRLMVGIYSGDVCLGSPSILPPVYCDPVSSPQHNAEGKAILASKQAVPGVQPATSISLVMQLQASGGYDIYGYEVTHLAPRGWMKLHLFDHHDRLITGRWKVPIRLLPAKPSMTTAEVNFVPQLDNAELYLRIVNTRYAEIQSSVPISINNAGIYQFPPVQTPRHPLGVQESHESIKSPDDQRERVHDSTFSQHLVNTAS